MKNKIAIIIRGLPGSGKSTIAELLANSTRDSVIHSTDSYFYHHKTVNGKVTKTKFYDFNIYLILENHTKNLKAFTLSCKRGKSLVICDNTNVLRKNYKAYEKVAKQCGYSVMKIIIDDFRPLSCYQRGKHGVPYSIIKRMTDQFQK